MSGIYTYTFTQEPTFHEFIQVLLRRAWMIVLLVGLVLLALGPRVMEDEPPEEGP